MARCVDLGERASLAHRVDAAPARPLRQTIALDKNVISALRTKARECGGSLPRLITAVAVSWSASVALVYAVRPGLRYEYMPQIRDGNPVQLWLELGKVIRPDVQTALPSFYSHEDATLPLAILWVAVAAFLGVVGYVIVRRTRPVITSTP